MIVRTNQSDMDPEILSQYVQEIIEENQDLFGVEIHDITYGMPTSTHCNMDEWPTHAYFSHVQQ